MLKEKTGLLMSCIGGFYYVKTDEKVYECKARGIFRRYGNSPLAGDRVRILIPPEGYPSVEEIIERKNFLNRLLCGLSCAEHAFNG